VDSERFTSFTYDEVIAREIVEDLAAALVEFEAVATALEAQSETAATHGDCQHLGCTDGLSFRLHRWTMTTSLRRPSLPDQRVHRCQLP